jgi:anaphase-promoting complex subunit 3
VQQTPPRVCIMLYSVTHSSLSPSRAARSIAVYNTLPPHHFSTHLVSVSLGRCYFDLQDYSAACRFYESAREQATSLQGMDVYSTALWHLGDASTLSSLALWSMELDSLSAESWVVVGNVFSLAKEHELSLKFFRRAIQCDPHQPYACTLSAHEYMANEDFERAQIGYRLSLGIDERFYNAWYGLGNLYLRQEKYSMAVYHFRRAISIHPSNSTLHCYLGMTFYASKAFPAALRAFRDAEELERNNPLAKYHLAHVYMAMGRDDEAMKELQVLKEIKPREANVHFLMGKISKKMGKVRAKAQEPSECECEPT